MEQLKTNRFKIVGRLISADTRTGVNSRGHEYISVNAVVKSSLDGKDNEFDLSFYSEKMTQQGALSQLYTTYEKLPESINHKVEITGELRENRYYSSKLSQVVSSQQLSGRWIRPVSDSVVDEASFEISGFVVKEMTEKVNKDNEVYRYDLTIALPNYNDTAISMYTLHVDPADRDIIAGVKNYHAKDTISLNGHLRFFVTTVEKEENHEGGFGAAVVKKYINKQKNFFIAGGSAPVTDERKFADSAIKAFIEKYKARDAELTSNAKTTSSEAVSEAPITSRQTSLI